MQKILIFVFFTILFSNSLLANEGYTKQDIEKE